LSLVAGSFFYSEKFLQDRFLENKRMQKTDLPTPIAHLLHAVHQHDTDAFLSCFAPDGQVNDWGTHYVGSRAIRKWSDREFIGAKIVLTLTKVEHKDREISLFVMVGGQGFTGPSRFSFALEAEKIKEMRITEK
jgi:hypothetical protein